MPYDKDKKPALPIRSASPGNESGTPSDVSSSLERLDLHHSNDGSNGKSASQNPEEAPSGQNDTTPAEDGNEPQAQADDQQAAASTSASNENVSTGDISAGSVAQAAPFNEKWRRSATTGKVTKKRKNRSGVNLRRLKREWEEKKDGSGGAGSGSGTAATT